MTEFLFALGGVVATLLVFIFGRMFKRKTKTKPADTPTLDEAGQNVSNKIDKAAKAGDDAETGALVDKPFDTIEDTEKEWQDF